MNSHLNFIFEAEENIIKGFNCSFETDIEKIVTLEKTLPLNITINDMLKGFFDFYSSFGFQSENGSTIIIILRDATVSENQAELPKVSDSINIQDPFDTTHNLTANINKKTLEHFISECKVCASLLVYGKALKKSKNKCWGLSLLTTKKALIINSPETKKLTKNLNELHSFTLNMFYDQKNVDFIVYILKECLMFEEIDLTEVLNKNKKRMKILSEICDQVDSLDIETSSKKLKTSLIESESSERKSQLESQNLQFKINNSWKSRRMTKRKIMNDWPESIKNLNNLQIEKLITKNILENQNSENQCININISGTLDGCLKLSIESLSSYGDESQGAENQIATFTSFVHFLEDYLNNCFKNGFHLQI